MASVFFYKVFLNMKKYWQIQDNTLLVDRSLPAATIDFPTCACVSPSLVPSTIIFLQQLRFNSFFININNLYRWRRSLPRYFIRAGSAALRLGNRSTVCLIPPTKLRLILDPILRLIMAHRFRNRLRLLILGGHGAYLLQQFRQGRCQT